MYPLHAWRSLDGLSTARKYSCSPGGRLRPRRSPLYSVGSTCPATPPPPRPIPAIPPRPRSRKKKARDILYTWRDLFVEAIRDMKQTDLITHCNIHTEYFLYDFSNRFTHTFVHLCLTSSRKPFLWRTRLSVTLFSILSSPEGCTGFRPDTSPQNTDIRTRDTEDSEPGALHTGGDPDLRPHRQTQPERQQRLPHPPPARRAHVPRAPNGDKPAAHGFINDDPTSLKRTDKKLAHAGPSSR
jgi:hypothetical protein